jgi:phage N-6-adenine-methyltransferase
MAGLITKVHPIAALFPMLQGAELAALAEDIRTNGLQQPIMMQGDTLLDGRNRLAACETIGIEPTFVEFAGADPIAFIIGANLHRRHLSESQRAMIAARMANMRQGARTDLQPSADLPKVVSQPEAAEMLNVSERSVRDAKLIEREAPELAERVMAGEVTVHAAKEQVRPHVAQNSGNNEWYTPPEIIEDVRAVMGSIDCDPASSDKANETIGATTYYTERTNGLSQKWQGNVWMNPPYAQPLISEFSKKLVSEIPNINQACVLVNNATETAWFQSMLEHANAVCFLKGRVKYLDTEGNPTGAPLQGQAVLYFGPDKEVFANQFDSKGQVLFHA